MVRQIKRNVIMFPQIIHGHLMRKTTTERIELGFEAHAKHMPLCAQWIFLLSSKIVPHQILLSLWSISISSWNHHQKRNLLQLPSLVSSSVHFVNSMVSAGCSPVTSFIRLWLLFKTKMPLHVTARITSSFITDYLSCGIFITPSSLLYNQHLS